MQHVRRVAIVAVALLTLAWGQSGTQEELAAARRLLQAGRNNAAIAKLNEIATHHPGLAGLKHELGVAYYRKSDYLKAIEYLKPALEEKPDDRDVVQLLGLAYYLSGQPARAVPYLEQLQSEASVGGNRDATYVLGLCYALTQDYPHALAVISTLYDLPVGSAAGRLVFSRVLLLQGLDPVAEEQVRQVLKEAPNTPEAHFVLGQIYLYRSDLPRAMAEFQAELAINPAYTLALTRLGDAYTRAGQLENAQMALQRSIWLDASNAESYALLGKVLLLKREYATAPQVLQRAIAIDPNDYTAHHLLGEVYRQLGQNEMAAREMQIGARLERQQPTLNRK